MKCEKCPNAATWHVTEIHSEADIEELHLCEVCAHKYLADPQPGVNNHPVKPAPIEDEESHLGQRECDACGLKFVDFRNTGRLGCPHDYDVFQDELVPLLESVHGDSRHIGKTPRRHPEARKAAEELTGLRRQLTQAVTREDYEEAARLRDQIRRLEEG
jgi:protein arginine kinase activator